MRSLPSLPDYQYLSPSVTSSHKRMAKAEDGGPAIMAKLSGPGPAKYYLKGTCGYMNHDASKPRSPAYKLSARVWPSLAKQDGPGPAAYFVPPKVIRMGRDGYPSYSLYGRHQEVKIFCTPAPGELLEHAPALQMR